MVDLGVYFSGTGDAPGQWTTEPTRAYLTSDLAPGASETITVTATAPTTSGIYVLRQRMVKEWLTWFDQLQKTSNVLVAGPQAPAPAAALSAAYSASAALHWIAGQMQTFAVTVTNNRLADLECPGVQRRESRLLLQWHGRRTRPVDQRAGPCVPRLGTLPLAHPRRSWSPQTAPASPGNYTLRLRMVKENVGWFDQIQKTAIVVTGTMPALTGLTPALVADYSGAPPVSWQAGQTKSYTITLTNAGAQTWHAAAPNAVLLGVYFNGTGDAPGQWTSEPARFALPTDVDPGESVTLAITVTAPTTAGTYVLRQRLVEEGVTWFDQLQKTSNVAVGGASSPTTALSAVYSATTPLHWQPGQTQTFTVTATNTGTQNWNAQGPNALDLGAYFDGTGDGIGQWQTEPIRAFLTADVAPRATGTILVTLAAPTTPGSYDLRLRMVEENLTWFDQFQKSTISVVAGS